jgi:chromosome segregation ATPase
VPFLLTEAEYLPQEQRLSSILNNLTEEIDPLEKLIKTTSRNLNMLEDDRAKYGGDTDAPLHLRNQIQEAEEEIEKLSAQLKPLKAQQTEAQRRLEILENRWRMQQELSSTSPESPVNE